MDEEETEENIVEVEEVVDQAGIEKISTKEKKALEETIGSKKEPKAAAQQS